jgi:hypothetical protein
MIIYNTTRDKLSLTKTRLRTTGSFCHNMSMRLVDFRPKGKCKVYYVPVNHGCVFSCPGINVEVRPENYRTYSRDDGTGYIGCQNFDAKNFSKIVKAAAAAKKAAKKKGVKK